MLEKPKKIYFTHIKGTNNRNIFPLLMFQQLLVNKHRRLRDSKSRTRFGREKFGSAYREKQEVETTYNRAFLTPLFALIKTLRDIWPLQLRKLLYFRPSFFSGEWGILKIPAFKDSPF